MWNNQSMYYSAVVSISLALHSASSPPLAAEGLDRVPITLMSPESLFKVVSKGV